MLAPDYSARPQEMKYEFWSSLPFALVHVACLAVFLPGVGVSWPAVALCVALYFIRMHAITGWYHRYFSHRTFKTSRAVQFLFAFIGATAVQKGALWWAAHHRHHHRHSDQDEDIHSPGLHGIWWAHVGWICCEKWKGTDYDAIRDFAKYPELRFLNKNYLLPPLLLALACYLLGYGLEVSYPALGATAWQMTIWGFFISTTVLYHATFCINSFCHIIGRKRYPTGDQSRNSLLLALITLGEGWHNNHHYYPGSEKQGFYWYEIDISHMILKTMSKLGLVWDLAVPPAHVLEKGRQPLQAPAEATKQAA